MKLKNNFNHTIIIEKSKFITYLSRIENEDEAKNFIIKIKKMHPDARHHCSAFVCNKNNTLQRSNDDGEPKGTAGSPMLNVLNKFGIKNTVAVVVRYFGGIKLGTGGLIRAYSNSVSQALDLAPKVKSLTFSKYKITVPYSYNNKIESYMRNNVEKYNIEYDLDCSFTFLTANKNVNSDILEITSGKYFINYIEDIIIEKDL
jgi:uncharacterized YigZ family protein